MVAPVPSLHIPPALTPVASPPQFVRPLYRELMESPLPGARELAVGTFAANREAYHPICRKMVAADIERALAKNAKEAAVPETTDQEAPLFSPAFVAGVGFGAGAAAVVALVLSKRN